MRRTTATTAKKKQFCPSKNGRTGEGKAEKQGAAVHRKTGGAQKSVRGSEKVTILELWKNGNVYRGHKSKGRRLNEEWPDFR